MGFLIILILLILMFVKIDITIERKGGAKK